LLAWLRRIAPAVGLFFLAPLTAEYLIGYLPETGNLTELLGGLYLLAPLYGGAALIIREVTRHTGRGWPTIILLAFAFGVFQAGVIDQSLFDQEFLIREGWEDAIGPTFIPVLGIVGIDALSYVPGHVIWSICAPIAIVEAFVPNRRTTPWLGGPGLFITVILYGLACIAISSIALQEPSLPSVPQFIGATAVVIILIGAAFAVGRDPRPRLELPVPKPWQVGALTLLLLSLPTLFDVLLAAFGVESAFASDWRGFTLTFALYVVLAVLIWRWSQRQGWSATHTVAIAGGALLTRAWVAFLITPVLGDVEATAKLIHNAVFALGVVALLVLAAHSTRATSMDA
jgi:hypothetical protein